MLKSNVQRIEEMHRRAAMLEQNERQIKVRLYTIGAGLVAAAAMYPSRTFRHF